MDVPSALRFIRNSVIVIKAILIEKPNTITNLEKELAVSVYPLFRAYALFLEAHLSKNMDLAKRLTSLSEALQTLFFLYESNIAAPHKVENFMHFTLYYDLVVTIMSEFQYAEQIKQLGYPLLMP